MARRNPRRPGTGLNSREMVIFTIIKSLYTPHVKFWENKLTTLVKQNQVNLQMPVGDRPIGVHYAGKAWFVKVPDFVEDIGYDILPFHPDEKLEAKLIKVTANLGELDIEKYEAKRFLAGLISFPAPIEKFERTLGAHVYNLARDEFNELAVAVDWNVGLQKSWMTYVKQHDYLIDALCQRVMINLISSAAIKL